MISIQIIHGTTETPLKIYEFDSKDDVLKRYVVAIKESHVLSTVPRFLNYKSEFTSFEANKSYHISDIRDEISKEASHVLDLAQEYPKINLRDLLFLWLLEIKVPLGNKAKISYSDLEEQIDLFNLKEFNSAESLATGFANYKKQLENEHNSIKVKTYAIFETKSAPTLLKTIQKNTSEFRVISYDEINIIQVPDQECISAIFDMIKVDSEVPLIALMNGINQYSKVISESHLPLLEWVENIENSYIQETIFDLKDKTIPYILAFFVLDKTINILSTTPYNLCLLRRININTYIVHFHITVKEDTPLNMTLTKNLILRNFDSENLRYKIVKSIESKIKANYTIKDITFNKALFTIVLMNDSTAKGMGFFIRELDGPVTNKERYTFYFDLGKDTSLSIIITPIVTIEESSIELHIKNAVNREQVHKFMTHFAYLLIVYQTQIPAIEKRYTSLSSKINFDKFYKRIPPQKKNKKTGDRLAGLQKHNSEVFAGQNYARECMKPQQPYLVDSESKIYLEKVFKKLERDKPTTFNQITKHGLLEWPAGSGDTYACYPREGIDNPKNYNPDDPVYIWPGVTSLHGWPCCYKTKTKALKAVNPQKKAKGQSHNYILQSTIPLTADRMGKLPYLFSEISSEMLRFGVIESEASFIHCFETAFNSHYRKSSESDKRDIVTKVMSDISNQQPSYFVVCRQEFYDVGCEKIREKFTFETYIDPLLYIHLMGKWYDCNVILLKTGKEFENGDFCIPRHHPSIPYIPKPMNKKKTIVIMLFEKQCELVIRKGERSAIDFVFDKDNLFIENLMQIMHTSYSVL